MYITPDEWAKMDKSIREECHDLDPRTGISVILWKLQSLMDGYFYALGHGYSPRDERETNP